LRDQYNAFIAANVKHEKQANARNAETRNPPKQNQILNPKP